MILATIDPSIALIAVALLGFMQAITLTMLSRNNSNTKRIRKEHEPNGGTTMYDTIHHLADTVYAMNRRMRRHDARIIRIERKLGIKED